MGRIYEQIDDRLAGYLTAQPVFFVATAPLSAGGHVNCSPKGNRGELAVLDGHTVAYLEQTGSGIETVAHLRENGRIVLMFCSFDGPPRIVRLHGRGEVVAGSDAGFADLTQRMGVTPGIAARSVIVTSVERISDSCGYGVPLMDFVAHRPQMDEWGARKGLAGVVAYREEKNARSIDGLPGMGRAPATP